MRELSNLISKPFSWRWKIILRAFKILIAIGIFYFLHQAIFQDAEKPELWLSGLLQAFRTGHHLPISVAFLLIPLNWGLEAVKWQLLSAKLERLSFRQAIRSVLVGITFGFITPNRLGDYAGRIMELQNKRRLEAIGAIFLGRYVQLCITVLAGSAGIIYFIFHFLQPGSNIIVGLLFFAVAVNLALFGLLLYPQVILAMVAALPGLKRFIPYVAIIATYSHTEIKMLLQISSVRYLVFILQFMLLLNAFGVQTEWWLMAVGISSTFLFKSLVPSVSALSDLGMRELSAMFFFGLLHQDKILVMSASLSLWFLNIALPTLVGLLVVWQLKTKNIINKD